MKEAVTKFDFESAFKALDEIEIPAAGKVRANRPALTEIFSRKSKFDYLMEEYYDISSTAELEDAQEAREAEVAKAKLERIEKIVDLDAESPEDLLTSYVGKYIIQCPQCMTLFYKDKEDVVESEEDPNTVNVSEICQHCGNESGYTLVGKVDEAEAEAPAEELPIEEPAEEAPVEENPEEEPGLEDTDLDDLNLNLEDEEEEKKEESFAGHEGEALVEELADDPELDNKLEANDEYIEYLRAAIAEEEAKLEKASNEQIKVILQRNIEALNTDLEAAVPDAVKNGTAISEEPAAEEVVPEEPAAEEAEPKAQEEPEVQEESYNSTEGESLTEALHEDNELDVSAEEFEELIDSPEFKKPISDSAVRAMLNDEKESEEDKDESVAEGLNDTINDLDEIQESALEEFISNSLVEAYGNVAGFRLAECAYADNNLTIDGTIYFTSGNTRKTTYKFNESYKTEDGKISLTGLNEKLGLEKQFTLTGRIDNKTLITESFKRSK